jgi:hypothetical protein
MWYVNAVNNDRNGTKINGPALNQRPFASASWVLIMRCLASGERGTGAQH